MRIIKSDKTLAEEERKAKEIEIKEQARREARHEAWKKSDYFDHIMEIVDEEIDKVNNISLIPKNMSVSERGEYALAMQVAYDRLNKIKKRLSI